MKKIFISILALSLLGASCKKKSDEKTGGCTDSDSPFFQSGMDFDDGSCKYAYVTEVQVLGFPEKDNGQKWDAAVGNGKKADIYFKMKPVSAINYTNHFNSYENVIDDADYNTVNSWTSPIQFKLTDEDWSWEIQDKDFPSSDDLIGSGTINPIKSINTDDNSLTLLSSDGATQIKLKLLMQ